MAKVRDKITVIPAEYTDFVDIKKFVKTSKLNLKTAHNGERINWLKKKHIQVHKGSDEVLIQNNFHETFKIVPITPKRKVRQSARTQLSINDLASMPDKN